MAEFQDCCRFAAECLALANRVGDEDARHCLIELAAAWRDLALAVQSREQEADRSSLAPALARRVARSAPDD